MVRRNSFILASSGVNSSLYADVLSKYSNCEIIAFEDASIDHAEHDIIDLTEHPARSSIINIGFVVILNKDSVVTEDDKIEKWFGIFPA